MSSLADAVIRQQSRQATPGSVPDGYYLDDLGYWVENDIKSDKDRYARYLLLRITKLHPNIYRLYGQVYCGHTVLTGSIDEILKLVDLPSAIVRAGQAAWIFNRIKELAPEIDESKIIIGPDIYWDFDKADILDLSDLGGVVRVKDGDVRTRF